MLLGNGGQCNPWTRELLIRKYLLKPLATKAPAYYISEVGDSSSERIAGLHLCTARSYCPMLFCLRCLKVHIHQMMVAMEEERGTDGTVLNDP